MRLLTFDHQHHQDVEHLLRSINAKDKNAYLTFSLSKTHCQIVGGNDQYPQIITLPLENSVKLKTGTWSISASSFKEYWHKKVVLVEEDKRSVLEVSYQDDPLCPRLEALTADESNFYIRAVAPPKAHQAFLAWSRDDLQDTFATKDIKTLLNVAETYRPFEIFEINKDEGTITTERDQQKVPHALPEGIDPVCNLMLNHESIQQLTHLCDTTEAADIHIYTDDEKAIFSDGQRTFSSSLESLKEYKQRQSIQYKKELKLVIEIAGFNEQIRSYRQVALLKESNEALLYVDEECVMLASLVSETGENCFLSVKDIKVVQPAVYRINLSELSKVPIKDITSMDSVTVQMLKSSQGDYKLGFYNEKNRHHPYHSVHDVAPAPDRLRDTLAAKDALERKLRKYGRSPLQEAQQDLIGFDDV